jgi:hypothetical protein
MIVVMAALGASASAEEEAGRYRTAVSAIGGLSVGSSHEFGSVGRMFGMGGDGGSGAAVGGVVSHDLNARVTLEAAGMYLDRNASAWSADAGVRLNLVPSSKSLVPYLAASGGVYSQRSLDQEFALPTNVFDPRAMLPMFGGLGAGRNDDLRGFVGSVTTEVRNRVREVTSDASARRTDGMLSLGGGVAFAAGPRVFVRPDVRAQMVFSRDTHVYGLFTLSFGYRF